MKVVEYSIFIRLNPNHTKCFYNILKYIVIGTFEWLTTLTHFVTLKHENKKIVMITCTSYYVITLFGHNQNRLIVLGTKLTKCLLMSH